MSSEIRLDDGPAMQTFSLRCRVQMDGGRLEGRVRTALAEATYAELDVRVQPLDLVAESFGRPLFG
jgi:hypothetical protein